VTIISDDQPQNLPTVTIKASPAKATEGGVNGGFTVQRSTSDRVALTVYYTVSGTATSGSDYLPLSGSIMIPRGSRKATFPVTLINDTLREGAETVVVILAPRPTYLVGSSSSATVKVISNE
jgi:hypothetical protein